VTRIVVAVVVAASAFAAGRVALRADVAPPARDAACAPRLRARTAYVHSDDPSARGTTAWLFAHDPSAAYEAGRDLFTREFTEAEGVFGRQIARPLLADGVTPMVPGSRAASCAACHNTPFGDAGAGPTIAKNGPAGRNTPHLFGAGVVEMIGWEIRARLLAVADRDGDGFIGRDEAAGVRALIWNVEGDGDRVQLDFGRFDDADGDGRPDLDPVCRTWFVDASGRRLPSARRLDDAGVAGYDIEVQVFGWGHAPGSRAQLSSTLRGFSAAAFNVHAGLQAHDPTLNRDGDGFGVTGRSLCGAAQFFSGRTPDLGRTRGADGVSLDDPDGDGVADEVTEGDLDVLEFFLLNHPAPTESAQTPRARRGREVFARAACVRCHVPDWSIADDRRVFDPTTGARRTTGGASVARGVFSDFRYHDLGAAFHERQFDGSETRRFRTPPLWGVGSSAPYGHDGASLDLDAVIRRHGGEAAREAAAYAALPDDDRDALLAFLRGLVLSRVADAVRAR
jgi:mono/diheme cytochrome c family protein